MYVCHTYNFGNRNRVGITFELADDPDSYYGSKLIGSICYWFFGDCYGDMVYGNWLSSEVYSGLEYLLRNIACHLEVPSHLMSAAAEEIVAAYDNDMNNILNDRSEQNSLGFVGSFDFWRNLNVSLEIDTMEEFQIFYFEDLHKARLIVMDREESRTRIIKEYFLNKGELTAVIQESFDWLSQRYEQEVERENCSCPRVLRDI